MLPIAGEDISLQEVPTNKQTVHFGKYKNQTWDYVLSEDPKYIMWVLSDTNQTVPDDIAELAQEYHLVRKELYQLTDDIY